MRADRARGNGGDLLAVFVYGSLISPKVCEAVLNRVPESDDAVLHGYARYSLRGRLYPAVKREAGSSVRGRVLWVSGEELGRLDEYESDEYERLSVSVLAPPPHSIDGVQLYCALPKVESYMLGEWSYERFESQHLAEYLAETQEFVDELDQPQPIPPAAP